MVSFRVRLRVGVKVKVRFKVRDSVTKFRFLKLGY